MCVASALLRVVVASKNPTKVNSVKLAFQKSLPAATFEFLGVSVASGVRDQPIGDEETLRGARNRVAAAAEQHPHSVCVAIEGGIGRDADDRYGSLRSLECFAWAVIRNAGGSGEGKARSASFMLPPAIARLVEESGMELGDADDEVFGRTKSGSGTGTVGHLTKGLVTRTDYYEHCVCLALIPFLNEEYYPGCALWGQPSRSP